jgi:hypothetical protein
MIEESQYKFPHEEPKRERTDAERQAARENEDALYDLGFRPFGYEW